MAVTRHRNRIKKALVLLGHDPEMFAYAIDSLAETEELITTLRKSIKEHGATLEQISREGNKRVVVNPAVADLNKSMLIRRDLLKAMGLTPDMTDKIKAKQGDDELFEDAKD